MNKPTKAENYAELIKNDKEGITELLGDLKYVELKAIEYFYDPKLKAAAKKAITDIKNSIEKIKERIKRLEAKKKIVEEGGTVEDDLEFLNNINL